MGGYLSRNITDESNMSGYKTAMKGKQQVENTSEKHFFFQSIGS